MYVLDTDTISILQAGSGEEFIRLSARVAAHEPNVFATVVSVDEQFRGWMASAARRNTPEHYVYVSARLIRMLDYFQNRRILPFDDLAAAEFRRLKAAKVRIGTPDLRIASIVLSLGPGVTLVSRNLRDFTKVPRLHVEDWTRPT